MIRDSLTRPAEPSERLNGWKDVAAHVGKSIRTAQRWEKIFDLPVHRITTPNGEVVYAFRTELDAWLRGREPKVASAQNSAAPEEASNAGCGRLLLSGSAIGVAVGGWQLAVRRGSTANC